MREPGLDARTLRLLMLLADHLEHYLEGGRLSFGAVRKAIEQGQFSTDDIHAAILALHSFSFGGEGEPEDEMVGAPGRRAVRVWSAEERDLVSPEAWGYLLHLQRRGSLDHDQFERVLEFLVASGERPVGLDFAREVAARVALDIPDREEGLDFEHGEVDVTH